jgi:hypothetical protein
MFKDERYGMGTWMRRNADVQDERGVIYVSTTVPALF